MLLPAAGGPVSRSGGRTHPASRSRPSLTEQRRTGGRRRFSLTGDRLHAPVRGVQGEVGEVRLLEPALLDQRVAENDLGLVGGKPQERVAREERTTATSAGQDAAAQLVRAGAQAADDQGGGAQGVAVALHGGGLVHPAGEDEILGADRPVLLPQISDAPGDDLVAAGGTVGKVGEEAELLQVEVGSLPALGEQVAEQPEPDRGLAHPGRAADQQGAARRSAGGGESRTGPGWRAGRRRGGRPDGHRYPASHSRGSPSPVSTTGWVESCRSQRSASSRARDTSSGL